MRLRSAFALLLTAAVLTGGCSVDEITGSGYEFADTLPQMVGDFGEDARVISGLERDGAVTFVVIGKDGRVHERAYELVCSVTGSRHGTSCNKRTTNRQRAPLRGERDSAGVTLGELDEDVVDHLRDEADAFGGAPVGLRGRRWVVAAGAFKAYVADLDGSDLHRAESAADRQFASSVS